MGKHTIAQEARTGFAASSLYDAHRPSFPPEAISRLLSALQVEDLKGARIADLAAGTGKFTTPLTARSEEYNIIAIEPHDGMRLELERKNLRNVKVLDGAAEEMSEISDASLDAVVAAQAFHWFANKTALQEIHRVLKPTGVFGMIWNIDDYNAPQSWDMSTAWESKVHQLTWTFDDGVPRFRHQKWRDVFDEQLKTNPFSINTADPLFSLPLGEGSVKFETWLEKEQIWKRYRCLSQIAILEGKKLESAKKTFFDAINGDDVKVDEYGRVAVHGQTFFAWTSRIPGQPLRSGG